MDGARAQGQARCDGWIWGGERRDRRALGLEGGNWGGGYEGCTVYGGVHQKL